MFFARIVDTLYVVLLLGGVSCFYVQNKTVRFIAFLKFIRLNFGYFILQ